MCVGLINTAFQTLQKNPTENMHWDDFVKYFTKLALEVLKLHINAKRSTNMYFTFI